MPGKGEKWERTTIRTDMATRERIKKLAQQNGMTQEKFLEWMADQAEAGIPQSVDQPSQSVDRYTAVVDPKAPEAYSDPQSADINHYDLLVEIKSVKKVVYRMIKELCKITDADVNDPDSGITVRAKYDDQLLHPEKYRRRYSTNYGKRN